MWTDLFGWGCGSEFLTNYAAPSAVGLPVLYGAASAFHYASEATGLAQAMAGGMGGGAPVDRDDASSDSSSDTSYDSRLPATLRRMFSRGAPRLETAEARRRRVQRWWKDRMMSCVIVWVDLFALILLT